MRVAVVIYLLGLYAGSAAGGVKAHRILEGGIQSCDTPETAVFSPFLSRSDERSVYTPQLLVDLLADNYSMMQRTAFLG